MVRSRLGIGIVRRLGSIRRLVGINTALRLGVIGIFRDIEVIRFDITCPCGACFDSGCVGVSLGIDIRTIRVVRLGV